MATRSPFLRKRFLVPVGVVAALAVALAALNPGRLARDLVVRRASEALGRPVTVESVRTSFLPDVRVRLAGLAIGEAPGVPLASLSLESLELRLALLPLLKRELAVTSVDLLRPTVVLRADASAPPGSAPPGSAPPPAPGPVPLRVAIRKLTIRDGAVSVLRADGAPLLELAGLGEELTATLARDGRLTLAGETTVSGLRIHLPQGVLGEGLPVSLRKDLAWSPAERSLQVAESTLRLGDLAVGLSGRLDDLGSPAPRADLRLSGGPAQVSSLVGFLPPWLAPALDGISSGGEVALSGFIKGPLGPPAPVGAPLPFAWELDFALTDGRVSAPGLAAPLSGIEVRLRAHDDTVELARFAAATPRSRLDVSGTMTSLLATPRVDLRIATDLDLAEAMALQPPQPGLPELAGRFTGAVGVSGPVQPVTALALSGGGRLVDLKMSGPDLRPAIDRIDGPIRLEGQRLYADGVTYRQGPTDLTVTGTVDNFLALVPELKVAPPAVLAARADIRLLDADAYAAPPGARKEAAGPGSGLARLGLLSGSAQATVRRLLTKGHELQDVQGAVDLDRGRLTLRDVRGAMYGGRVDLAGVMDFSDPAHGKMDLEVALAGVQVQELSKRAVAMSRFARLGGLVTGLVDGRAQLKGALDDTFGLDLMTLTTSGQVELKQARLAGSPLQKKLAGLLAAPQLEAVAVEKWLQPFRIEDGKLHVDGLALKAAGVDVRAAGWQALDGTLALGVEMTVPPVLAEGLRSRLPAPVAAVLLDGGAGPLVVPVGLSGRWEDPQVQLDTESLAAAAADRAASRARQQVDDARRQVQDKVQDKVQEQVQDRVQGRVQDAAAGALQRLTGQPADTAGADSASAPPLQDQVKSLLKGLRGGRGK